MMESEKYKLGFRQNREVKASTEPSVSSAPGSDAEEVTTPVCPHHPVTHTPVTLITNNTLLFSVERGGSHTQVCVPI